MSEGLTYDKMMKAMDIIENEGWTPTHYVFSQGEIELQRKYCEEHGITSVGEFFAHLMKGMLEMMIKDGSPKNKQDN